MLVELEQFQLPPGAVIRHTGGPTINSKHADLVWDTTLNVVWVFPKSASDSVRVYGVGGGTELRPRRAEGLRDAMVSEARGDKPKRAKRQEAPPS